jgi:hypothetical protein
VTYGTKGESARCLVSVGAARTAKASNEGWRLRLRPNIVVPHLEGYAQGGEHGKGFILYIPRWSSGGHVATMC